MAGDNHLASGFHNNSILYGGEFFCSGALGNSELEGTRYCGVQRRGIIMLLQEREHPKFKNLFSRDTIKKFVLYFLLIAGGLWHLLGVLEKTMTTGAPLAMVILAFWLIYEYARVHKRNAERGLRTGLGLAFWMFIVFSVSILIEYIGVRTGVIFGTYQYGSILKPTIGSVPVVIGFAWLNMILSSMAVAERFLPRSDKIPLTVKALVVSLLMVIFDFIMEPAAVELGYWSWEGGTIPFQNYLAWFLVSFIFMVLAYLLKLFKKGVPVITQHAYYAQLIYFILVNIKTG